MLATCGLPHAKRWAHLHTSLSSTGAAPGHAKKAAKKKTIPSSWPNSQSDELAFPGHAKTGDVFELFVEGKFTCYRCDLVLYGWICYVDWLITKYNKPPNAVLHTNIYVYMYIYIYIFFSSASAMCPVRKDHETFMIWP